MYLEDLPDTFPWHLWPHETTEDEPPAETQRRGVMRKNISPTLGFGSRDGVPIEIHQPTHATAPILRGLA